MLLVVKSHENIDRKQYDKQTTQLSCNLILLSSRSSIIRNAFSNVKSVFPVTSGKFNSVNYIFVLAIALCSFHRESPNSFRPRFSIST